MTSPAQAGHNNDQQAIIKRMLTILSEQDTLTEDMKELKKEAKALGMKAKAIALALREHRKPVDEDTKNLANQYFLGSGGQYSIFA